ncbi:MAG: GreA/GreB family elongation factor [Bacteroidetes bacterium]|nr:GreA/GreB family elongation factor [Bacteroidota bacterium]
MVDTNINTLFFATAMGKINVNGKDVMVLSVQSPLGVALNGKAKGDVVDFNGRQVEILEVN